MTGMRWQRIVLPSTGAGAPVTRLEAAHGMVHATVFDQSKIAIESAAAGGDAWRRSATAVESGAGPVPDEELVLSGAEGWIVENDRTVIGGARYHDGRWTPWQPPCSRNGGTAVIAASTSHNLIAVCQEGQWFNPPPVVYDGSMYGRGDDLGFTNADQGVVIEVTQDSGPTGTLLMTRDGGRTWTPVTFAAAVP